MPPDHKSQMVRQVHHSEQGRRITNHKQITNSNNPGIKFTKFVIFILFGICFLKFGASKEVLAYVQPYPIPSPTPIPCGETGNPEFHSLRPYQASPCETTVAPLAKFCGNDLTLQDSITVYYPGSENYLSDPGCVTTGNTVNCTYTVPVSKPITINLSGANLPFMGNTEDVINSQSPTDSLTDADKMNGYVSWYLNGVMNRAENGDSENTATNAANFSGPLNKLLPGAILDAQRIQSIANATGVTGCVKRNAQACTQTVCAANGTSYCCSSSAVCTQLQNSTPTNHDQIVVCADPDNGGLLGGVMDFLQIGRFKAVPCYAGDGSPAKANRVLRLSSWNEVLGFNILANNTVNAWLTGLRLLYPSAATAINNSVGNHWQYARPPLPWDDGTGVPFATEDLYTKAYQEWRGNICAIVPIINKVVCMNNLFVQSYYADFYPYIPLSSTEDKKGAVAIDQVSAAPTQSACGITVTNVTFTNQTPSILFFPHMIEASQEASLLQSTFVASSESQLKTANPTDVSTTACCSTLEVRSNKGDNLFATPLTGTLNYTASFSCQYRLISTGTTGGSTSGTTGGTTGGTNTQACQSCLSQGNTPAECNAVCNTGPSSSSTSSVPTVQTCTKTVSINLTTISGTPDVENVWSETVAGPQSIFKMIFPKTNVANGVGQIIDMPGATNITYTGTGITQQNTDLKFPHIGGISEYFLKGIQTMLRPQGYGMPVTFAPASSTTTATAPTCAPLTLNFPSPSPTPGASGDVCATATKYNIPCCQLQGIMQVETANGTFGMSNETCTVSGKVVANCCLGNNCGPANLSCSQYAALNAGDNLNMCNQNDSAELLSRAMLLSLCQADQNTGKIPAGTCSFNWATSGTYVTQHYNINQICSSSTPNPSSPGNCYTAAAYFYGLGHGCAVDDCSQYRWGAGKGYCDAVAGYCPGGTPLTSSTDNSFCAACAASYPAGQPTPNCPIK